MNPGEAPPQEPVHVRWRLGGPTELAPLRPRMPTKQDIHTLPRRGAGRSPRSSRPEDAEQDRG